ncbi:MAG: hypothetical protein E7214_06845 [Clostridium sp.]|nr:hypothetical protein [Clostridium sp.]
MTFKAYFKKEFMEAKRENRLIILFAGFFILALMSPVISKIMPSIIQDKYGEVVAEAMKMSASECVANYLNKDFGQVCILVLCLVLGGILCDEITKKYIVLPITKGGKKDSIVFSKFIFYSITMFIITVSSMFCVIYYTFTIFEEDMPKFVSIMYSSINVYIYVLLIIAVIFFWSSIFTKSIGAALMSMTVNMVLMFCNTFEFEFNPYLLVVDASNLVEKVPIKPAVTSVVSIIVLVLISMYIFKNKEIES